MTGRPISELMDITSRHSIHVPLVFLRITHPRLNEPVRVVRDAPRLNYTWGCHLWTGVPFGFTLMSDNDTVPEVRLVLPNITAKYLTAFENVIEPARVEAWLISSANFDLTVNPRTEIGTAHVEWSHPALDLVDTKFSANTLTGRVVMPDLDSEPVPSIRVTADRFPGVAP
jgi:hypothetical protein